ncbi:MAG: hypothetical protein EOO51_12240 [Flavobacterium sp.]|nr:MAG: hypothetical protein EOO51_12240 [Flavobacterium sp.]
MKYFSILLFCLVAIPSVAQDFKKEDPVYSIRQVEVKPEFDGGMAKFYEYITRNFKTPDDKDLKGMLYVSFIIEKDGTLSGVKVLRDLGHGTGDEITRVLTASPKWKPATVAGNPVRVQYSLPVKIGD